MNGIPIAATAPSGGSPGAPDYQLSSPLAHCCLPAASRDVNRKFAYANSVCAAFLVVGLIGLKARALPERQFAQVQDIIPIEFTPPTPEEQPPPDNTPPDPAEPPPDPTQFSAAVATVVAADSPAIAFAIPVEGPVVLVPAKYAPPPPLVTRPKPAPPPQPVKFTPSRHPTDGGIYPWPTTYPRLALDQRLQGTVTAFLAVDAAGTVITAEVKDSSGHGVLDRFAVDWFLKKWRFPPLEGPQRQFLVDMEFRLK